MELTYNVSDEFQLNDIALELLNKFDSKLYLFYGEMGVGKTTFIKYLINVVFPTPTSPCKKSTSPFSKIFEKFLAISAVLTSKEISISLLVAICIWLEWTICFNTYVVSLPF